MNFISEPQKLTRLYEEKGYWQGLSLGEEFHKSAELYADRTALVDGSQRLNYAELAERINRMAGGFHALGLRSGDRALVQLPNTASFVVVSYALFRLGVVPIFALPAQRLSDLDALCHLAEPTSYIVAECHLGYDYRPMAATLADRHPSLRHIVIDGNPDGQLALGSIDGPLHNSPWPHHLDTACLLLSGGTTGTPKLIPRRHTDYAYAARSAAAVCELTKDSVYLAALPAAHNFTLGCPGIVGTFSCGGKVVMARTPGPDETFGLIAREKVTFTALVPALVQLWLHEREWDKTDISSLRLLQVGGARLGADVAQLIQPQLGCVLQQVFGMAEGLLCFTGLGDSDDVIFNTQGRPLSADDEIRIVDSYGTLVGPGEAGELLTRGPYTISGYYRAEEHNKLAFTSDGFYRSGDLARIRPDGNIVIEGRIKEQINRAGEKISLAEVEGHLRAYPDIREATLVGLPDEILGERTCAVVVPVEVFGLADIHAFLMERGLPRYKLPDQLHFVDALPLTSVGKIDRRRLIEELVPAPALKEVAVRPPFLEQRIAINTEPLELAALISESALADEVMVYERAGEWSVGFGMVAEVKVSHAGVHLREGATEADWPINDIAGGLSNALKSLERSGWRAYGTADFEFACLLHSLPISPRKVPLLRLVVPRFEVRLHAGEAHLRGTDEKDISLLLNTLRLAEARLQTARNPSLFAARQRDHRLPVPTLATANASSYQQCVSAAVADIDAGRYQKVILSRRVPVAGKIDVPASYVAGRRANQPARSFLVRRGSFQAAGFSPETVVEVYSDGRISTQPLAGTRSLGSDEQKNAALALELITNTKEIAEHAVSVRHAFEEATKVSEDGSVNVSEFMTISRRGSVQHLASRVKGRLSQGSSPWHALLALFPAVTASGIPKREAIDAILKYETCSRGLYSGCVLIADEDGTLDAALVLRSFYTEGDESWLQAGAGVVSLSTPEGELEETCGKLGSVAGWLVAMPQKNGVRENETAEREVIS